jgi:hypothetical protein
MYFLFIGRKTKNGTKKRNLLPLFFPIRKKTKNKKTPKTKAMHARARRHAYIRMPAHAYIRSGMHVCTQAHDGCMHA